MKPQKTSQTLVHQLQDKFDWITDWLREKLKTNHGRIILLGLAAGLYYFLIWSIDLLVRAFHGSLGLFLIGGMVSLAFQSLWSQRKELNQMVALHEDRLLGHLMILAGFVIFPFCRFALWSQGLVWLVMLTGIVCSTWGTTFFNRYKLATLLLTLSIYPRPGETTTIIWQTFMPYQWLERRMAWGGTIGLQAIGQPAKVSGTIIFLDHGAVDVNFGCSGFHMAISVGIMGAVFGLFFKQRPHKIALLIIAGVVLALLFNIPRIMLMAIASVYWESYWFNFWHSSWGSQIFVGTLLTVYYYILMTVLKQPDKLKL